MRYPSILWERNVARREDDMEGPDALQDAEKGGGEKSSGYMGTMDGCTDEYLKPLLDALGNRAGLEKQLDSF